MSESIVRVNVSDKNESAASERHWSVAEIAAAWNLSRDVVRRLFSHEPGVLMIGRRSASVKRRYTTIRVPQSVFETVYRRLNAN
jgi:hypothetical protein